MKKLIINSDDYGRTSDISRGIREVHLRGVLSSTTCMMNIPTTVDDIAIALKETPKLGMGVHLVLTMGKPLSKPEAVPSIVDENGNHLKYNPFFANVPNLNMDEVKAEWRLQIERFIKAAGRKPTHLDSHHHSSYWSPALFRGMLELAREYDCPIRNPFTEDGMNELAPTRADMPALMKEFNPQHPDRFISSFYDDGATRDEIMCLISELPEGTTEIMCHPGYVDDAFAKESVYNFQRERELKILTDPAIKQAIQANGIELITFAELDR
jgi:chitin disaccharide deacetylase